jgi:hypothetical protein
MTCPICEHPRRVAIDEALRGGASPRAVAAGCGVGKTAVYAHRRTCLGVTLDAPPATEPTNAPSSPADMSADTCPDTRGQPPAPPPRAREAGDPKLAISYEDRVRFCADILVRGQWSGRPVVRWLCEVWGVHRDAVHDYRRAGAVLAAGDRGDLAESLEDTLGAFRKQEEDATREAERLAEEDPGSAARYQAIAHKARTSAAQVLGLLTTRISISLEADPRIAGLWRALWEVLGEVDAELRERESVDARRLSTFLGAVERLTGGPLPAEVVALVARSEAVPSVVDTVRAAVRRYEERIGARSAGSLGVEAGG